jgi:hypothetical protein
LLYSKVYLYLPQFYLSHAIVLIRRIQLYILFYGLVLASCTNSNITEGVIEYEISYPGLDISEFMLKMLPSKMIMKFKDNKFKTIISKGKMNTTALIADCHNKTLLSSFRFGNKKLMVDFTQKEINTMLNELPLVTYLDVKGKDTCAGFNVLKKVAVFKEVNSAPAELWYTNEIELENPNWIYPYNKINGVLLMYELERYGLRMRFKATKFINESIDDAEFEAPIGFKKVSFKEYDESVRDISGIFIPK